MKDNLFLGIAIAVGIIVGLLGFSAIHPATPVTQTGGDFAGGIVPSQLFAANSAANSLTPVLSNFYVPGAISVGGTSAANQITAFYTATTSYPSAAVTLGAITNATSATSTVISFTWPGFAVGDYCNVAYNGATTTTAFGMDGMVTSYNTSTNQGTTTVTFWNGSASAILLSVTSTFTGASSTVKATCYHTGV